MGKGRVYTVDYGINRPLYKQLWSLLFAWAFFMSLAVLIFPRPGHITYADPIVYNPPVAVQALPMPAVADVQPAERILYPVADNLSNLYAWGNCTAYVASKLPVPNDWGNAITWGYMAAAQGYTVSDVPKVGSIAWSTTDSYLGHVALVEAVDGDNVTISEMNYNGLGVVDTRLANPGEFRYIYLYC